MIASMLPRPLFRVAALVPALAGCGTPEPPSAPEPAARSLIVYLVDTLRADHLGSYGYERDTSPAIDAFAAEGVLFEHCLAQSTWTKPATASVLTGLYPGQHGANKETLPLRDEVLTLAEMLSAAGLRTVAFYANSWLTERHGLHQGFDTFERTAPSLGNERTKVIVDNAKQDQ